MTERNSGGNVNYYLVKVERPKRLEPYTAEAEDIMEALGMNFAEGCAFKAIWRRCAAKKLGVIKKNYDGPAYDGEKAVYYSQRMVAQDRLENGLPPSSFDEPGPWLGATLYEMPGLTALLETKDQSATAVAPTQENPVTDSLNTSEGQPGALDVSDALSPPPNFDTKNTVLFVDDYQRLAMRTAPPDETMLQGLVHASLGLTTEIGEYVTEVKRMHVYQKPMTPEMKAHMLEELGDVAWYIALATAHLDVSLSSVLQANIDKLRLRFPDKFSTVAAEARADKGGADARSS